MDGIYPKRCRGGEFENISVLITIGVGDDGYREIIGASGVLKEDSESWRKFFTELKACGLEHVKLIIDDKVLGMVGAVSQVFPKAKHQRCTVRFYRNVLSGIRKQRVVDVVRKI